MPPAALQPHPPLHLTELLETQLLPVPITSPRLPLRGRVLPVPPQVDPQGVDDQLAEARLEDVVDLGEVPHVVALPAELVHGLALVVEVAGPGASGTGVVSRVGYRVVPL